METCSAKEAHMADVRDRRIRVVIAGGGVAGLEATLALRELAPDLVAVELLAPEPLFWYRPASVAEPFGLGEARHFELAQVAAAAGATFTPGALVSVDVIEHEAHTAAGAVIPYDVLFIACGAVAKVAIPGALTFRGPGDTPAFSVLLDEIEAGDVRRLAFVVPWGAAWVLPLYELALMTAAWLRARRIRDVELTLVTPESEPLELFGRAASESVRALLDEREITVRTRSLASAAGEGELRLLGQAPAPADRVVALPRLHGQPLGGIPHTINGFIPVDAHGFVADTEDVFAAGDITNFSVKQGGIAAQQALAAAESIAARAGVDLEPSPFHPVLRGMLLTGAQPRYLRRDLDAGEDAAAWVSESPIWWPPAKVVGRYLAPFLATLAGAEAPVDETAAEDGVHVDVELVSQDVNRLTSRRIEPLLADLSWAEKASVTVGDVMSREPLVVAPEDTLGEVAERMRQMGVSSALVAEFGRLIGILTARDLLQALAARMHSSEARVRQWMTADPVVVTMDTAVEKAALLMTEYGIHHLPVVDDERPIGMIGLRDVTRSTVTGSTPAIGLGL
jgi:sulfide:quinone oxidoreductase